jgi:hypothetical protein
MHRELAMRTLLLSLAVLLAACADDEDAARPDATAGTCDASALAGLSFSAKDPGVCPGPGEPQHCDSRVTFEVTKVTWKSLDVFHMGAYECQAGVIVATFPTHAAVNGSYDPASGELTWNGEVYTRHP